MAYDTVQEKFLAVWQNNSNHLYCTWVTSNGSSAPVLATGSGSLRDDSKTPWLQWDSANKQFLLTFRDAANSNYPNCVVLTSNGTNNPTLGTKIQLEALATSNIRCAYVVNSAQVAIIRSGTSSIKLQVLDINGTSLSTSGSVVTIDPLDRAPIAIDGHPSSSRVITGYRDDSESYRIDVDAYDIPVVTSNMTTENFIGFSTDAISNGASGTVATVGNQTTQSSLTAGQKYYIQKDGTLGLTPATNLSVLGGIALSSTKLLIK